MLRNTVTGMVYTWHPVLAEAAGVVEFESVEPSHEPNVIEYMPEVTEESAPVDYSELTVQELRQLVSAKAKANGDKIDLFRTNKAGLIEYMVK